MSSLVLVSVLAAAACGDDGGSATDGSGGSGTGPSSGPGAGTGLASVDPGSPNNPEDGCLDGFTACGDVCADLTNDNRFCGDCDTACSRPAPEDPDVHCVGGACVPVECTTEDCFCSSAVCDDVCRYGLSTDADACGSCHNQCAADAICFDGACASGGGDGTSCNDPVFWNVDEEEEIGFRWSDALASEHVFVCGPLDPLPTRWFRVTMPADDGGRIEVGGGESDDFIVEVFSDDSCTEDASVACADGERGDEIEVESASFSAGATFWIAIGLKGEWSGLASTIGVDG